MENFTSDDAWAITKLVKLSNRKKQAQIDNATKQRMLSQWEWWRTNYLDEPSKRAYYAKQVPIGPTRKLLDKLDQDTLIKHHSPQQIRAAQRKVEQHLSISRFRHETKRAHQLALTNSATTNRMLQSTSNSFLGKDMSRMATGVIPSRASAVSNDGRDSLRSAINSLSLLDFLPTKSGAEPLPPSPAPYFEDNAVAKKYREIRMLYLDRFPTIGGSVDFEIHRKAISLPPTAVSSYSPDLESTSARIDQLTMESLKTCYPVIVAKCSRSLWRNPAI